jgi:hypothetical protein
LFGVALMLTDGRLQTVRYRLVQGPGLRQLALLIEFHQLIEPGAGGGCELPFALIGEQVAQFGVLIGGELGVSECQNLLVGECSEGQFAPAELRERPARSAMFAALSPARSPKARRTLRG